jgi:hypothetical protein
MALGTDAQSGDFPGSHERTTGFAPPFHASVLLALDFKPACEAWQSDDLGHMSDAQRQLC